MQRTSERSLLRQVPDRSTSTEANLRQRTAESIEKPVAIEKSSPEKKTNASSDYNSHKVFTNRTPQVSEKILSILNKESGIIKHISGKQSWENVTIDQLRVIERLVINDENLTELHPKDFQGLLHLQEIDLRGTNIKVLPEELFREIPSLKSLLVKPGFSEDMIGKIQMELNPKVSIDVDERNDYSKTKKVVNKAGWGLGIATLGTFLTYLCTNLEKDSDPTGLVIPLFVTFILIAISMMVIHETSDYNNIDHKMPKPEPKNRNSSSNDDCCGDDFSVEGGLLAYSAFVSATW